MINIKENNLKILKNGPAKEGGGLVLKNSKVYLFGGSNGNSLSKCDYFDLEIKDWKSTNSLPKASDSVTATLWNEEIILSGYNLNCAYSYNESVYTSILFLPENITKIVCEKWIFANSILYENQEDNNAKWIIHNISESWDRRLCIYSIFKKKEYLYFIDDAYNLMRIDTKLKKLENIKLS